MSDLFASYENEETGVKVELWKETECAYRVRVLDLETNNVVPVVMWFANQAMAIDYAKKCAA